MIRATIVINSPIRLFNFQTLAKNLTLSLYKPYFLSPNLRIFRHRNLTAMVTVSENQSPPSVTPPPVVILTEKEKLIFNRLLKVVNHFNLNTQLRVAGGWVRDKLRVAGGWVRDKLLGKDCIDIDIALDNMMGQKFCEKVNEYLTSTGEETHGIGVIQCNPDQSKHLETARMRLFDLWIDFVNLRSEDYCENSRIPTMRFGTAEEDAYRRDLTINSLFYNINTSSVEDFTGKGLADLRSGKIVTPLPPKETFLDDPLRVLRAIRFGARFEFTLDDELKRAACDEEVRSAIADKISRERIGHEVDLMISGNQPVKAIEYISNLKLFPVVFSLPPEVDPCISAEFDKSCVAYMDATWSLMQLVGSSNFTDEQKRLGLYSTLFLPLRGTTYRDNKAKKVPAVDYIFRSSLKLKASDAETVINVHNATRKFMLHIPSILSEKEELETAAAKEVNGVPDVPFAQRLRVKTGLILREIKEFWRVALLASVLLYPSEIKLTDLSSEQLEMELRIDTFKTVEREILDLGLEKVWEIKPLVNGKEIMNVLQLKTGGPLVKDWQRKLLEWQLVHPSGTSEECLDWMRQTHSKEPKRARPE